MDFSIRGLEVDYDCLSVGKKFPNPSMNTRNADYNLNNARFNGTYANNKFVVLRDTNGLFKSIVPYEMIRLPMFKLYTHRMFNLMFNTDPVVKLDTPERTKQFYKLAEKTCWLDSVKDAVLQLEKLGDSPIKTYINGCSSFSPTNAFKIVQPYNKNEVRAYVLYEYLRNKDGKVTHIRFEIHWKGSIWEQVFNYNGIIGEPVDYVYQGRDIPKEGIMTFTGVDEFLVQWLSIDKDEGYGHSPYEDFAGFVHEIERRQSQGIKILDKHSKPSLAVGMGALKENPETGKVEADDILGTIFEVPLNGTIPQYITWDGKLDANDNMIEMLFNEIYMVTELSKPYMNGDIPSNISEESINSLMKSAIDRGNRHVWDIYYEVVKSVYVLCRLNGIEISRDDISINFGVGQSDSTTVINNNINSRVQAKTMSLETALQRYDGLTEKQAQDEIEKIHNEGGNTQ